MDIVYTIVVIFLIDEGHEKSTFFLVGCACVDITKFIFFSLSFLGKENENNWMKEIRFCAALCVYIFFIFFCSSAWTWTLCVSVIAPTHTHRVSLPSSSSFHPRFFFCVLMAGDKSYANLWLIPFVPFFSPLHNFPQQFLSLPISMEEEEKKNSFLPPHKSFYRLESRSRWCTSRCPFFYV